MRNLKRALSLLLATVMVIGMMVTGASAASYNDFADRNEIVNKDAVSMLATLEIMEGNEKGEFLPNTTFDRQQMAALVSRIMNKGANNNDLYLGADYGLLDLNEAGTWAQGHINYCYSTGIIAGDGIGHFFPTKEVTAVETAKMLLVAIGYDPVVEGLVGEQWMIRTSALASKQGLFDNYEGKINDVLTRDNAALLVYNALDVEMIEVYENGYARPFKDGRTILSVMYGVFKIEGVVVANEWAALDGTDSDARTKDGKTTLDHVVSYESATQSTNREEGVELKGQYTFNVSTTVDMIGKTVTLYVRKTTILADSEVLGVSTKDNVNVVTGTAATTAELKNLLKGTGLTETKYTEYYVNYGHYDSAIAAIDAINEDSKNFNVNGVEVEVIDNNGDGDVDYVLFLQETLSLVTKYNTKTESITVRGMNLDKKGATTAMSFDDVVFVDEVTTDDFVLFIEFGGRSYISLPETVTGAITRVDRNDENELFVTIDGETYYQSFIPEKLDETEAFDFVITNAQKDPGFTEATFILDSNGYIVSYTEPDAAAPNYALVLGSAWSQNALTKSGEISVMHTDGTEENYAINWKASAKNLGGNDVLEQYLGTRDVVVGSSKETPLHNAAGTVIKYSVSDDKVLTIKDVLNLNNDDKTVDFATMDNVTGKGTGISSPGKIYTENLTGTMNQPYERGDARLYVDGNKYAIDLDTLAFYYDVVTLADFLPANETLGNYLWSNGIEAGETFHGYKVKNGDWSNTTIVGTGRYDDADYNSLTVNSDGSEVVYYGVATGYDNMFNVEPYGTNVEVYTGKDGKLVTVALFNAAVGKAARDYLYVLSANAIYADTIELNVVFMDGSIETIKVDRDTYEGEFEKNKNFDTIWMYEALSDDTYYLEEPAVDTVINSGYAHLIKNGTIVINNETQKWKDEAHKVENPLWDEPTTVGGNDNYWAITKDSQVWDLTGVNSADDGETAITGKFQYNYASHIAGIWDANDQKIVVAWIWDVAEDEVETEPDFDTDTVIKTPDYDGNKTITIPYTGEQPSNKMIREIVSDTLKASDRSIVTASVKNLTNVDGKVTVTVTLTYENEDTFEQTYDVVLVNLTSKKAVNGDLGTDGVGGPDYTFKGKVEIDGNYITIKYTANETPNDVVFDFARLMGSMYRNAGITRIEFNGETYDWDKTEPLQGSNWKVKGENLTTSGNANTLVKAVSDYFYADSVNNDIAVLTMDGVDYNFSVWAKDIPGIVP